MTLLVDMKVWLRGADRPRTSFDKYCLWLASYGQTGGNYVVDRPAGEVPLTIHGPYNSLYIKTVKAVELFRHLVAVVKVRNIPLPTWTELESELDSSNPDRVVRKTRAPRRRFANS